MATSKKLGQLVSDAIGTLPLLRVAKMTGISKTYLAQMKEGQIPEPETLAKFCVGMEMDPAEFVEAAKEADERWDSEQVLHFAAISAGLSNTRRVQLLRYFRQLMEEQGKEGK